MTGLRLWLAVAIVASSAACNAAGNTPVAVPGPPAPVRLIVDTDVGADDLVAISFLVASPSATISAITISGTGLVRCQAGIRIMLGLLDRLDAPAIPVACGSEVPFPGGHPFPDEFRANAEAAEGLDLDESSRSPAPGDAIELLVGTIQGQPGEIRLLALGPLTNVATAIDEDPDLAASIESVWIMGGAVRVPGNVAGSPGVDTDNTAAEWNIYADPAAAQRVLEASTPLKLVSLDGTNQVPVTQDFAGRVRQAASAEPALGVIQELFAENSYMVGGSYYLWDPLAAIFAAGYEIGNFTDAHVVVETAEGPTSGATRPVEGAPNVSYLSQVDAAAAEAILLAVMSGS